MRIYRVKKQENRQALDHKLRNIAAKQKYTSKKVQHPMTFYFTLTYSTYEFKMCFLCVRMCFALSFNRRRLLFLQTAKRKRGYIKNKLVMKKGKKLNKKSV